MNRTFDEVEAEWRVRLGMLPNTVRQRLVSRQVAAQLPDHPARVLDVGCGQGTQALRLAELGHTVTGVDYSPTMLADFERALAAGPAQIRDRIRLIHGDARHLADLFAPASFDVVCCHGLLMYLPNPAPVLSGISRVLVPGGLLSLLVRNADALALNPGLRGDWAAAQAALDATRYLNRLGMDARADRLDDLTAQLDHAGLDLQWWYGVLVFCEHAAMEATVPPEPDLAAIVACEEETGRTDPYRRIAALLHLIARRADRRQMNVVPDTRTASGTPGRSRRRLSAESEALSFQGGP